MTKRKKPDDKKASLRQVREKEVPKRKVRKDVRDTINSGKYASKKVELQFNQQELRRSNSRKSARLEVEESLPKNLSSGTRAVRGALHSKVR